MDAEQLRRGALQEAAFYRAKVATLEGNAPTDLSRIEKDRVAELERQLGALSAEHSNTKRELQRKLSTDGSASALTSPRPDKDNDAIERAEEAEEAHRLALQELAELQAKHTSVETSLRELNERFITSSSTAQQREAERDQLRHHLEEAEATHDEHLGIIAQAQAAISSSGARTAEVEALHQQATTRIQELEAELSEAKHLAESRSKEVESVNARLAEVEGSHAKSREEAESLRSVTTGRLGQLLDNHKARSTDKAQSTRGHQEQVRALEEEGSSLRKMLREAGQRVDAAESGVSMHRDKARELEMTLRTVKAEMRGHRSKLGAAQGELAKYKERHNSRDMELRDREMAVTEMETRVTVLRNLCKSFHRAPHCLQLDERCADLQWPIMVSLSTTLILIMPNQPIPAISKLNSASVLEPTKLLNVRLKSLLVDVMNRRIKSRV
jgi:chromosome segregation ATPase